MIVGTRKKSAETRFGMWLSRKVRQFRDGGFRCWTMYFATVASETWIPSFHSSPGILVAPSGEIKNERTGVFPMGIVLTVPAFISSGVSERRFCSRSVASVGIRLNGSSLGMTESDLGQDYSGA